MKVALDDRIKGLRDNKIEEIAGKLHQYRCGDYSLKTMHAAYAITSEPYEPMSQVAHMAHCSRR